MASAALGLAGGCGSDATAVGESDGGTDGASPETDGGEPEADGGEPHDATATDDGHVAMDGAHGTEDAGGDAGGDPGRIVDTDCSVAPRELPPALGLDPFYDKYVDVGGIPLISSDQVRDEAFPIACDIIKHMMSERRDVLDEMIANGGRVGIIAEAEVTTDIPEHSDLNEAFPATDWDDDTRGVGATLVRPVTTVGEENLLQLSSDPYLGESILVHEFAHGLWNLGVRSGPGGSAEDARLVAAYEDATGAGKWDSTYAATNEQEYWAEAIQSWFDSNLSASPPNGIHNDIDTREELRAYDEGIVDVIADYFPDGPWRPTL